MVILFLEGIHSDRLFVKWKVPARPGWRVALYFGIGAVVGTVSALLIRKPLVQPSGLQYASLLVAPIIVAMVTSTIAYLRGPKRAPPPRLAFWYGLALAAGLVVTRIAIR